MFHSIKTRLVAGVTALSLTAMVAGCGSVRAEAATSVPDVAGDTPLTAKAATETAVFAGGCFWGIQAVYQHIKGVISATSGYAGGTVANPSYEDVSSGSTGHAEAVKIVFDPSVVSYGTLLKVFFSVAHDPTQLNYQGPDHGTQYRSAVFYTTDAQKNVLVSYLAQLTNAKTFSKPIVTQVSPFTKFYDAEDYHQNYYTLHPDQPYIVINDKPKVENLRKQFPDLYAGK